LHTYRIETMTARVLGKTCLSTTVDHINNIHVAQFFRN